MNKLEIYNKLKEVPKECLKEIRAGRLKGMSDIKPQWRVLVMTETFGLCGIGWKFKEVNRTFTEKDSFGQIAVFVDIELFIKVDDKWSDAIPGNGGSVFIANEKNGLYMSDEAVKMATTDALSVAMKMIGVGADVYMGHGGKYDNSIGKDNQPPAKKAEVKEWLSDEAFKIAMKADEKGVKATLNVYDFSNGKGMSKDKKEQLSKRLFELKNMTNGNE